MAAPRPTGSAYKAEGRGHDRSRPSKRMGNFAEGIMSPFLWCLVPSVHEPRFCGAPSCEQDSVFDFADRFQEPYTCGGGTSGLSCHDPSNVEFVLRDKRDPRNLAPLPQHFQSQTLSRCIDKPNSNDVLCGKGENNNPHLGNRNFRKLIGQNRDVYGDLTKKQKVMMARQIVHLVNNTDPPGRYLAKEPHNGLWYDIGLARSLEKTAQVFRDEKDEAKESFSGRSSTPAYEVCPLVQIPESLKSIYPKPQALVETSPSGASHQQPVWYHYSESQGLHNQHLLLPALQHPTGARGTRFTPISPSQNFLRENSLRDSCDDDPPSPTSVLSVPSYGTDVRAPTVAKIPIDIDSEPKVVESRLSLEERVIRSPSNVVQGRSHPRLY